MIHTPAYWNMVDFKSQYIKVAGNKCSDKENTNKSEKKILGIVDGKNAYWNYDKYLRCCHTIISEIRYEMKTFFFEITGGTVGF